MSSEPTALNSEDAMTPASTRYTIERLLFLPAIFSVNQTESKPKTSAIICVSKMLHESIIARIAPTHVPLVTPRISGVASGLENNA